MGSENRVGNRSSDFRMYLRDHTLSTETQGTGSRSVFHGQGRGGEGRGAGVRDDTVIKLCTLSHPLRIRDQEF